MNQAVQFYSMFLMNKQLTEGNKPNGRTLHYRCPMFPQIDVDKYQLKGSYHLPLLKQVTPFFLLVHTL